MINKIRTLNGSTILQNFVNYSPITNYRNSYLSKCLMSRDFISLQELQHAMHTRTHGLFCQNQQIYHLDTWVA